MNSDCSLYLRKQPTTMTLATNMNNTIVCKIMGKYHIWTISLTSLDRIMDVLTTPWWQVYNPNCFKPVARLTSFNPCDIGWNKFYLNANIIFCDGVLNLLSFVALNEDVGLGMLPFRSSLCIAFFKKNHTKKKITQKKSPQKNLNKKSDF